MSDAPPLRILTQATSLSPIGGVEVCTYEDVLALVGRKHHVDIAYTVDGDFAPEYRSAGVGLHPTRQFSFDRRRAAHDLLSYLPAVARARRLKPDVLWLNRVEHLVWGQVVARSAGVPMVAHLHGPPVHRNTRLLGRGVAQFIAVSRFIKEAYVAEGIEPDRITVVHNAVPSDRFSRADPTERVAARRALGLPLDRPVVLAYGRMSIEKGATDLLEAWHAVLAQSPDALLVLVDAMSNRPEPEVAKRIGELPEGTVRIFPMTTDVLPFLHAADVVAFPTRLPESFGRVALEGMMAGLPVIAARVGAVPEILADRFLVPAADPAALAAGILPVLGWRADEPGLGAALAADAATRFPHDAHIDALERILAEHAHRR